jgi:hypothetical protein
MVLAALLLALQDGIRFQGDLDAALQQAKKSGKSVMIAFFQPG